uniref:Transmembrane protein 238 n=1 Tax=Aquila chrysaetos chrysaetos TaxID=223781 RepID=A0A663EWI7_AQUCH
GAARAPPPGGAAPRAGAGGPRRRWRRRSPAMAAPGGLGRCVAAFWLALAFDALGLAVLLAGVFADVFFSDLLIYAGGIGIFLSLVWWVFWYAGNLEVPPEELRDDVGLSREAAARAAVRPVPGRATAPGRASCERGRWKGSRGRGALRSAGTWEKTLLPEIKTCYVKPLARS